MSKKSNPFKNFNVFKVECGEPLTKALHRHNDELEHFAIQDPNGQSWSAIGLTKTPGNEYLEDLDGKGTLLCVAIRERILPSSVRDRYIQEVVASIEEREGRKVGRKEYAEIRDEAENDLLPKAFIKESRVYCIVTSNDRLFVFTSSHKRCDDIVTFLIYTFKGIEFSLVPFGADFRTSPVAWMTSVALQGVDTAETFFSASPMVLKNDDETQSVARIKDADTQRQEYLSLIKKGFLVQEMGITYWQGTEGEPRLQFKLTKALTFKGVTMTDAVDSEGADDFHALAWLVTTEYNALVTDIVTAMSPDSGEVDDDEL